MRLAAATADQAMALAALHARTFPEPWTAADIAEVLRSPGAFCLAAEDDAGILRGFLLARAVADEGEILTLAVDPQTRRAGIGRALVAAAAGLAAVRGVQALFLEVASGNAAAIALYQSEQFESAGLRRSYYANGDDALVLRRLLNTRDAGAYVAP